MAPRSSCKVFYTLDESKAFESNPDIQIVYFTEKGIDLLAAIPETKYIDYAMRNGYSWYHVIDNPPRSIQQNKEIRIVRTTEAELAIHQAAPTPVTPAVDHKANILARIDQVPNSEWTQDKIADVVVDYMWTHNISDFTLSDEICEIVGPRIPKPLPVPDDEIKAGAETTMIACNYGNDASRLGSISAWLVTSVDSVVTSIQEMVLNILPIPTSDEWILLD